MNIHITPLYRKKQMRIPRHVLTLTVLMALVAPMHSLGSSELPTEVFEQEYIITAYYSPLPDQCCYVKGGYRADQILNGKGIKAADGTLVYPGMIAAPSVYPFGTKITLPGLGTFAVHDRGGAIQVLGTNAHRLDIWVGHGEEGLARALEFGVQRVKGTVYPNGTSQPTVAFALDSLPSPVKQLNAYFTESDNFLSLKPKEGDKGLSVVLMQDYLRELNYFNKSSTGFFGPETRQSLEAFVQDYNIDAEADALSKNSAAHLLAARRRINVREPFSEYIDDGSSEDSVSQAKRLLRFLGYYRGRTTGGYDDVLQTAILTFQKDYGLVSQETDAGAGRIGPLTSKAITREWNRKLVARLADVYIDLHTIDTKVSENGNRIEHFLGEGYTGSQVRLLQRALADLGFFDHAEINGSYGPLTEQSVMAYQLERNIIQHENDTGAGYVGPATLQSLRKDQRNILYSIVRARGWNAL